MHRFTVYAVYDDDQDPPQPFVTTVSAEDEADAERAAQEAADEGNVEPVRLTSFHVEREPEPELETIHVASGRLYLTIKADDRASRGYMLRNRERQAIFGGTVEECMAEAGRLLEAHRVELGEEAERIARMLAA